MFNAMCSQTDVVNVAFRPDSRCDVPAEWAGLQTITFKYDSNKVRDLTTHRFGIRIGATIFISWRSVYGIFPHSTDERHFFWPKDAPGGSMRGLAAAQEEDRRVNGDKLRVLARGVQPRKRRDSGVHVTTLQKRARARWGKIKVLEGGKQ